MKQNMVFLFWNEFNSFNMVIFSCIHFSSNNVISSFFMTKQNLIVCINHTICICSSVDSHKLFNIIESIKRDAFNSFFFLVLAVHDLLWFYENFRIFSFYFLIEIVLSSTDILDVFILFKSMNMGYHSNSLSSIYFVSL